TSDQSNVAVWRCTLNYNQRPRDVGRIGKRVDLCEPWRECMRSAAANHLVDLVAPEGLASLSHHFTSVELHQGQTLQERGKPIESVVFPTCGMISIIAMMRDGTSVEVGLVGREGMLGVQAVLGDDVSLNEAMVQIPGSALCIPAAILDREAQASPQLRAILLR